MSIQTSIDRLNLIKERIRTNLIAQGVTVPEDAVLATMAEQILSVAGENGVSATHSWNGTTLTITSASGTSSADLKGERGEKGETGATGAAGSDYVLTDADKTAIATEAAGMVEVPEIDTTNIVQKSGDTMTGKLIGQANSDYTVPQFRNVIYLEEGSDVPATQDGDLVLFYSEE